MSIGLVCCLRYNVAVVYLRYNAAVALCLAWEAASGATHSVVAKQELSTAYACRQALMGTTQGVR